MKMQSELDCDIIWKFCIDAKAQMSEEDKEAIEKSRV